MERKFPRNNGKPFEPRHARSYAYRWWLAGLFAVSLVGTFAWPHLPGVMDSFAGGSVYGALVVVFLGSLPALRAWRRRVSGVLSVAPDGVYVGARRLARLSHVTQAVASPMISGATVRIWERAHPFPIDIEFDTDVDAQALVEALSMDSRQATAVFTAERLDAPEAARAMRSTLLFGIACAALVVGVNVLAPSYVTPLFAAHPLGAPLTVFLFVVAFLIRLTYLAFGWRVELVVGADGILAAGRGGMKTFYPFHAILDVWRDQEKVILKLTSGECVRFSVGGSDRTEGIVDERTATAVLGRILEARNTYASSGASSDLASVLSCGDRDVSAWRESLRSLLGDPTTYRTPAVRAEDLWRVLEDPAQAATARAGAAVALRGTLDEETRVRLRVATATCASAELRGAFEATLAEEGDEAVEQALGAIRMDLR